MQITNLPDFQYKEFGLRNIRHSDIPQWYAYLSKPHVIQHTSWNLTGADDLLPQFDSYLSDEPNSPIRLAIVRKTDDLLIGTVGFHTISGLNRSAELAYDLAPEYWGQRIAQVTSEVLCNWGFNEFALNRIQATVLETNISSRKVLERTGFRQEGYLHAFRMVRGKPGNFWMYARLHPELKWNEAPAA